VKDYIVFDLKDIARELGAHYGQMPESEHFAWCPDCGERIEQDMDRCPGCLMPVVWKNSRVWKNHYGSPTAAVRRYRAIMPQDEAGRYLMKRAKQPGFKDCTEAERWNEVVDVLGQGELRELVDYCAEKTRSRGLIRYVLNAAQKKADNLPTAETEDEFSVEVIG